MNRRLISCGTKSLVEWDWFTQDIVNYINPTQKVKATFNQYNYVPGLQPTVFGTVIAYCDKKNLKMWLGQQSDPVISKSVNSDSGVICGSNGVLALSGATTYVSIFAVSTKNIPSQTVAYRNETTFIRAQKPVQKEPVTSIIQPLVKPPTVKPPVVMDASIIPHPKPLSESFKIQILKAYKDQFPIRIMYSNNGKK